LGTGCSGCELPFLIAGWRMMRSCVSAVDSDGRTIWIVDAHRGNGNVSLRERMKS